MMKRIYGDDSNDEGFIAKYRQSITSRISYGIIATKRVQGTKISNIKQKLCMHWISYKEKDEKCACIKEAVDRDEDSRNKSRSPCC